MYPLKGSLKGSIREVRGICLKSQYATEIHFGSWNFQSPKPEVGLAERGPTLKL